MTIEKKIDIKKIIVILVFLGLLAGPSLLKPGKSSVYMEGDFGFLFKEVSSEIGIQFTHYSPILDNKIDHILPQIASIGAAVSVCDYNRDGWSDLYFTNSRYGTNNALYSNNGDGTFSDVADSLGIGNINMEGSGVSMGSIWGDIDNDGFEELFVYKWGKPELFKNHGGKVFENITETSGLPEWINANSAIWLDFDNDGYLDLFIGGYYDEELDLWNLNTTRIMPESYEYANNGGRNYLFKNMKNNTFQDVTLAYGMDDTKWTMAAGAADINLDGYVDLILANDYSTDEFYLNVGGKRFIKAGKQIGIGFNPKSGMNVSFGDINNIGDAGLYVTNITEDGILLQGNNYWQLEMSEGQLIYKNIAGKVNIESGGWSYGAQFGDFNNDGFQDLYVANGFISAEKGTSYWYDYSKVSGGNNAIISDAKNWPAMEGKSQSGYQQNKIWINNGKGEFEDVSSLVAKPITRDSRSVVVVDLWNRGVLDVVVANQNASPLIYKNEVSNPYHWIDFELIGVESNRDAVGSVVTLYWSDYSQVQFVTGGIGFSSQNQHRIHFGLGEQDQADHVEILWPSGKKQIIENPKINTLHTIAEEANEL